MDFVKELIALGIDSIIFGAALKLFISSTNALKAIKDLEVYDVSEVKEHLKESGDRIPYAAVQGTVKAVGTPIHSINQHEVTGVVQRVRVREHILTRGPSGFWTSHNRTVQETYNYVPFSLCSENESAEVLEPLSADTLDLYTVGDKYDPTSTTIADHLWGFFIGIRQRGVQSTEEILREGTRLTAIGEVSVSKDGTHVIIEHPNNDLPYLLTTSPLTSIIFRLKNDVTRYKFIIAASAVVGGVIISIAAYRWWQKRARNIRSVQRRERREAAKKVHRDSEVPDNQLCVVCCDCPREIIVLPCGHFCLCEDCSDKITTSCPICRTNISSKSHAYF